jgi:hypothetical protein
MTAHQELVRLAPAHAVIQVGSATAAIEWVGDPDTEEVAAALRRRRRLWEEVNEVVLSQWRPGGRTGHVHVVVADEGVRRNRSKDAHSG